MPMPSGSIGWSLQPPGSTAWMRSKTRGIAGSGIRALAWRLEALAAAGNEYFLLNQRENYESIFWSCYQDFPTSPRAAYCHWRVAFSAYFQRRDDAAGLLQAHVKLFPRSESSAAALYFLGSLTNSSDAYRQILEQFPNDYYAVLARQRLQIPAAPAVFSTRSKCSNRPRLHGFDSNARGFWKLPPCTIWPPPNSALAPNRHVHREAFGLELARMAAERNKPSRAIRFLKRYASGYVYTPIADAAREFWMLAYPLPYRDVLENYSEQALLDPFLVAALVRQESEFDPQVVSRAGAYGLTQVLPSTGRELSRRLGIRGFRTSMLTDPGLNLRLGTAYLSRLLTQLEGRWEPTLAAYNAGKSRAVAWQSRGEFREPAEYIETIPFTETRNYVKIVLRNADLYRRLYSKN